MKRRTFLIGGISLGSLLLGGSAYRVGALWWNQDRASHFQVLSYREVEITEAIVDAIFPGDHLGMPPGNDVGVVEALDDYLAAIDETTANLLRLLLHAIDEMAIPGQFSLRPFRHQSRENRIAILNRWDTSSIDARQQAFFALKLVLSMGYCEAPAVIRAAGIDYECGGWQ